MNTKQISDVKMGNSSVSALYQGNTKLWPLNSTLSGILQPENLQALYTVSTYAKNNGEALSTLSTGYWTEYVTKRVTSMSYSHISSYDSSSNPGVKYNKSLFSHTLNANSKSIYLRYRVSSVKREGSTPIYLTSSDDYGLVISYLKGVFTLHKRAGSNNNVESITLTVNPHEYHTYGFVYNGTEVSFYIDGEFFTSYQATKAPNYIYVYANNDYNITSTIETVAVYSNSHTADEVRAVSAGITSKYKYQIIPPEKGLLLYDHGNQCEEITNGWALNSYDSWSGTICTHAENSINLNGYNSRSYIRHCSTQPRNLIDFTPYTRLYFLLSTSAFPGDVNFSDTIEGAKCGYTSNSDHTSSSGRVYCEATVAGIGGKTGQTEADAVLVCMDISGVNGLYAPVIADGAGAQNGDCTKVYKVWLG
ncbi:MAG: LamG domain-containing protein [Ruminococcus sp.]|nr:LamG domain-containing protein [Ruminococcus sp.]